MATLAQTIDLDNAQARSAGISWASIWQLGGMASFVLLVYSLLTMAILVIIGGQPATAQEAFEMLQADRLTGLLRLDVLSIVVMPLYYVIFLAIYAGLRKTSTAMTELATLLVFAGLTLFLATPSAFSWLALSDRFVSATSDAQRAQLLAAGEAILASDMWHGSGALIGGVLLQTGALVISVKMLLSPAFGRLTGWVGIVTHGLDLAHILLGAIVPNLGVLLMAVAGPLYLLWFPLVAAKLLRLARGASHD